MAYTAQGTLAEIIQSTEGVELSPADVRDVLTSVKVAYQQMLDERNMRPVAQPKQVPTADPAYVHLRRILDEAYNQSAEGKGKERHVREEGQPFEDQPICQLQRMYGQGYAYGQVGKKMEESQRLPFEQAKAELLGSIVYLAAAIKVMEEAHGEEAKE